MAHLLGASMRRLEKEAQETAQVLETHRRRCKEELDENRQALKASNEVLDRLRAEIASKAADTHKLRGQVAAKDREIEKLEQQIHKASGRNTSDVGISRQQSQVVVGGHSAEIVKSLRTRIVSHSQERNSHATQVAVTLQDRARRWDTLTLAIQKRDDDVQAMRHLQEACAGNATLLDEQRARQTKELETLRSTMNALSRQSLRG